jgi:CheY-like chemotaxis protein
MSKKILLADDSITIQKVIELTFSDEDFDVVTVGNGRLALEKLADTRPDVVLCDIIMPERDGYEVCEQIKKNPDTAHVPVLLLTGAFEPFDQERAARVGSDGFLAKPFEPETLIAKVKELLARAPARTSPPAVPAGTDAAPAASPRPTPPPVPPAVAAAPATPSGEASFLPEEPFDAFDTEAMEESAPEPAAEPPLAPVTPEESAMLTAEPESGPPPADGASTVMFRPGEVSWPPPRASQETTVPGVPYRGQPAEPMVTSEPEGFLAPGTEVQPDEEGASFEEVLEEDVSYPSGEAFVVDESAPADDASSTVMFEPAPEPPPTRGGPSTGRFPPLPPSEESPVETAPPVAPEPPPPPAPAPPPTPPIPPRPAPPVMVSPPVWEAEPELQEVEPESATRSQVEPTAPPPPAAAPPRPTPPPVPPPVPPRPPSPSVETRAPIAPEEASFAEVGKTEEASRTEAASEAASVPVPVEMVEKIAQRVVAQVSERIVREIAWEVVPDLAEALIKQEIERLKAELQKP